MDDKEKYLGNDTDSLDDVSQKSDDTLEEKNGVKYETNDNWEFEAEAPTLNNDMFASTDFSDNQSNSANSSISPVNIEPSNQIVINKEPLKFIPLAIFVAVVIAVIAVLGVRYYTVPNGKENHLMNYASVAATIDGKKSSLGIYSFYLNDVISKYEERASYYNLDTSADYTTQYTEDKEGNKISWMERFQSEAMDLLKTSVYFYNAAREEGITLSDKQKDIINTQIESLKESASENNQALDDYIAEIFGEFCTADTVRLYLEYYFTSTNYKGIYTLNNKSSDEEINKFFDENKKEYYQVNISYLGLDYDTSSEEGKAESEKKIKEYMSKITDRQSIIDLVPVAYKDYIDQYVASAVQQDPKVKKADAEKEAIDNYKANVDGVIYGAQSPFDEKITDWLFDEKEPTGTVKYYVNNHTGYAYIILKTEQAVKCPDETYSVRHILITPEAEDDQIDPQTGQADYTDDQWKAAKEKAESILKAYNDGDKSESSFAMLAEKNSTDTESTSAGNSGLYGGLYENVSKDQMVAEFEDWAMDDKRKYGDTEIVKSQFGYHIMFFVNCGPVYEAKIISDVRDNKLEKSIDSLDVKLHKSALEKANSRLMLDKLEAAKQAAASNSAQAIQ